MIKHAWWMRGGGTNLWRGLHHNVLGLVGGGVAQHHHARAQHLGEPCGGWEGTGRRRLLYERLLYAPV